MEPESFSPHSQVPATLEEASRTHECYITAVFYGEAALLAPRPTPKLEDHPSSAVRDCLFNLFAATLHTGGLSSIRNLRKRHAVVTLAVAYYSNIRYRPIFIDNTVSVTVTVAVLCKTQRTRKQKKTNDQTRKQTNKQTNKQEMHPSKSSY
jgi:hypothetical protein